MGQATSPVCLRIVYTDAAMNLRSYYPKFIAVAEGSTHWLLEIRGRETPRMHFKGALADRWHVNLAGLTSTPWRYFKSAQRDLGAPRPGSMRAPSVLAPLGAAARVWSAPFLRGR